MHPSNLRNIENWHRFTLKIAEMGAKVGAKHFKSAGTANQAESSAEINREIALLAQREIRRYYLGHHIVDDVSLNAEQLGGHPTWVIDYLDGENNFSIGFPYFACSVALYVEGECRSAAVVDGLHREAFSYAVGFGSFFNGRRLTTPVPGDPRKSVISTSWADYISDNARELNTRIYERIAPTFPQQRRAGSIALDLCYIASGRFGGMYSYDPVLVDLAAGLPIALTAGCEAYDFQGNPFRFGAKSMVVGARQVMDVLLPMITSVKEYSVKTSLTHPYSIDFFPDTVIGTQGKLGMSYAPGKQDGGQLYLVRRDLNADLARLKQLHQIDVIVSLLQDVEYENLGIPHFFEEAGKLPVEVLRLPVADGAVPEEKKEVLTLITKINDRLNEGKNVLIHCKQGLDRTGIIAACLLIYRRGISPEEVIKLVQDARQNALRRSPNQIEFIRQFCIWLKERRT